MIVKEERPTLAGLFRHVAYRLILLVLRIPIHSGRRYATMMINISIRRTCVDRIEWQHERRRLSELRNDTLWASVYDDKWGQRSIPLI
jgi:hypothetical protein